jgi:hypothetical protein
VTRTRALKRKTPEPSEDMGLSSSPKELKRKTPEPSEDMGPSSSPKEGEVESQEYVEFLKMYPPMKKARSVNVIIMDECSGPSTEVIPPIGSDVPLLEVTGGVWLNRPFPPPQRWQLGQLPKRKGSSL